MLVGEQPGDQEDRKGAPFVGPAGRVLWQCLAEAGIERDSVYVTNAVKHFKHTDRGKRRLHKKPNTVEIEACHPWIEAELRAVRARAVVALGATAAQSLFGPQFRITRERGRVFPSSWAPLTMATYHPSAILRAPDADARAQMRAEFTADLQAAVSSLRALNAA
jgi:DNA polymerase